MKSIKNVPFRCPASGTMDWKDFGPMFQRFLREELREMDVRDPAQGVLADRDVTLPTLTDRINDSGQALDQRFMRALSAANKLSTQNIQPLSSNDLGGGFADIQIASHTVTMGGRVVSYNSGSITGLPNSVVRYVYADDPLLDGGAVTYIADASPNKVTEEMDRYYLGKITTDAPAGGGSSGGWGSGGGGGGGPIP